MDPLTMALLGMGGQVLGSALGSLLASGDQAKMRALYQRAMDEYGTIDVPTLQKLAAEQVGPTELNKVTTDPAFGDASMEALQRMRTLGASGGFNLADRADLNRVGNEVTQQQSNQQAGIRRQMAQRGQAGSGADYGMQLANQQAGAQRMSDEGQQIAARGEQRSLDATKSAGQFGMQLQAQEYGQKSRAAQAQDEINRQNAIVRGDTNRYNNELAQRSFDNKMKKAGAMAQGYQQQGNAYGQSAQGTQDTWNGVGGAINQGAGLYAAYKSGKTSQAKKRYPEYDEDSIYPTPSVDW